MSLVGSGSGVGSGGGSRGGRANNHFSRFETCKHNNRVEFVGIDVGKCNLGILQTINRHQNSVLAISSSFVVLIIPVLKCR